MAISHVLEVTVRFFSFWQVLKITKRNVARCRKVTKHVGSRGAQ